MSAFDPLRTLAPAYSVLPLANHQHSGDLTVKQRTSRHDAPIRQKQRHDGPSDKSGKCVGKQAFSTHAAECQPRRESDDSHPRIRNRYGCQCQHERPSEEGNECTARCAGRVMESCPTAKQKGVRVATDHWRKRESHDAPPHRSSRGEELFKDHVVPLRRQSLTLVNVPLSTKADIKRVSAFDPLQTFRREKPPRYVAKCRAAPSAMLTVHQRAYAGPRALPSTVQGARGSSYSMNTRSRELRPSGLTSKPIR